MQSGIAIFATTSASGDYPTSSSWVSFEIDIGVTTLNPPGNSAYCYYYDGGLNYQLVATGLEMSPGGGYATDVTALGNRQQRVAGTGSCPATGTSINCSSANTYCLLSQ